jgi:hypothetical protein
MKSGKVILYRYKASGAYRVHSKDGWFYAAEMRFLLNTPDVRTSPKDRLSDNVDVVGEYKSIAHMISSLKNQHPEEFI